MVKNKVIRDRTNEKLIRPPMCEYSLITGPKRASFRRMDRTTPYPAISIRDNELHKSINGIHGKTPLTFPQ